MITKIAGDSFVPMVTAGVQKLANFFRGVGDGAEIVKRAGVGALLGGESREANALFSGIGAEAPKPGSTEYWNKNATANAISNAVQAAASRIQVQADIKIEAPKSVDINVHVDGAGIQSGRGTADLPISATAPRGTTMATPPSPPVAR